VREAFGLDGVLTLYRNIREYEIEIEKRMAEQFRHDRSLINWIDTRRQDAIDNINSILKQLGQEPLRAIKTNAPR
jgi:hypothetical protein